jgi:hypothetical protein
MESVRDAWTDERLDDLNQRVDVGFRDLLQEMRELRSEMNARFEAVDARLDGIQRSMVHLTVAMTAAILTGFGGMAALVATQA